ncbi:chemotaxis protein MotA [Limimonas halophila]|uniref:Chemotaxis protein MotA n=1 Tax=Limimonas halophila TaxID=1082479 RepID=A0A1G7SB04_9PROT|nr:MotA/TolQ/ExbB proton channel family protein [Limimonas halophila]SDG19360.1 chemotaxis protein MotA [Limimonas halophila]
MRLMTLLGMALGLALLVGAVLATADEPGLFLNGPGAVVVLGGTFAATLMSYSIAEIAQAFKAFTVTLRTEERYKRRDLDEIVKVARSWHQGDVHGADRIVQQIDSPFLRTGLQMVLDTMPLDEILSVLDWRIARLKARETAEADVFEAMAGYAPAFGMVGTLLGVVNLLNELEGAAVSNIAVHLAVALVTTFYGIVLANAVFRPMAVKLRRRTQDRVQLLQLVKEAIILVSEDHGPGQIRYALQSYLDVGGGDDAAAGGGSRAAGHGGAPGHAG